MPCLQKAHMELLIGRNIIIMYKNWRGEKEQRMITPCSVFTGSTKYHPETQDFVNAYCHARQSKRDFAISDISEYRIVD